MHTGMTATAKGLQILKGVIPLLLGGRCAFAVNVMNLKVAFASAVLTGVVIAQKGCVSVASKIVVVTSFFGVLLQALFIGRKPLMDFANLCGSLAIRASVLRARFVNKILSAFWAVKDCTLWCSALLQTHFTQRLHILLTAVFRLAGLTNLLTRAGRRVISTTNNTVFGGVWHKRLLSRLFHILA